MGEVGPCLKWGGWWAFQRSGGLSLGVHLELRRRRTNSGVRFGPYLDVHVAAWTASLGVNPIYAGELDLLASTSRGGLSGDRH